MPDACKPFSLYSEQSHQAMKPRTLYDKIWDDHLVDEQPDGTCLIYVDRHLVHEVTSPQAFEGLRAAGRKVHAPDKTLAVVDHNVPTTDRSKPNPDPESAEQIAALAKNAKDFGIEYFNEFDKRQGIVHIIGQIGTAGGTGYALEYAGEAISSISMEGRMTICNMSVEGGAKAGFIAPDEKTYAYLKDKPKAPKDKAWDEAMRYWETLRSDDGSRFDREIRLDAAKLPPLVTWGTSPEQVISVTGRVPLPSDIADENKRIAAQRSLGYMGLKGGEKITDIKLDRVFIGSCTNARIEDLREVARVVEGKQVNGNVNAMIVPGAGLVKEQAEAEGLDKIFLAAGFDWREPGCSMCLAMNPDKLAPGERCASTSNRNFEGRQGQGGRTHLVSPAVAAATAIAGHFATPADLEH